MWTGVTLERLTTPLPKGFDPARTEHVEALLKAIGQQQGPGWEIESVSTEARKVLLVRRSAVMEVNAVGDDAEPDAYEIKLPYGTKPTDGDKVAARQADARPGFYLVRFEPHVGRAILAKMSERELRCRYAVANALGVKPWEVVVRDRPDGGFSLQLPPSYTPSKHDSRLQEVAESVVGRFGWYLDVDPKTLVAQILPSEPPTFPAVVPFPFDLVRPVGDFSSGADSERFSLNLAEGLAAPGEKNRPVSMSLDDSTAALVVGLPGSGKSVMVQSLVCQALVKGYRLAVIDTPAKKTDFSWAKPYVEDHWWGCDDTGTSVAEALTVATLVDEEGKRMGALLDEYGVGKWQELPPEVKQANPPIFVVADELANLLNKPKIPSGLTKEAKELPQFVQMAQDYLEASLLTLRLNALVAVHRAAGVRELYLSQRPSLTEGFPPSLKNLIPHRVLLGPSPSDSDLAMAFRDPRKVSRMPTNVASDPGASRGAGIAHLDGTDPVVMKGFYASNADFEAFLRKHLGPGDASDARVRPTAEQVAKHVPRADGTGDLNDGEDGSFAVGEERLPSGRPASSLDPKFGPVAPAFDANGKPLRGAARAAAQLASGAGQSTTVERPACPSCGKPIAPDGTCGCSW